MSEIRITDIKIQINDINNWIWIYQKFDLVLSKILELMISEIVLI